MSGVKISALPAVTNAALTDIFPVVQSGVTSQETLAQALGLIVAGMGISISTNAGNIVIASSGGGLTWSAITTATQAISKSNGYIANRGGGVAFSLPATSAVGDVFTIVGLSGIWSITQGAGQQIFVGKVSSTVGATGTLTANDATDSASFVCTIANTTWQVIGAPQTSGFTLA